MDGDDCSRDVESVNEMNRVLCSERFLGRRYSRDPVERVSFSSLITAVSGK